MRKDDILVASEIIDAIGKLHVRFSDGVRLPWETHQIPPNPTGLYSSELWWNRRVAILGARHGLSEMAMTSLRGALPDAIGMIIGSPGFGYARGGNQRLVAALDALDGWRREWAWKARRIAVTENTRAESERVLKTGGGLFKRWLSERDDRVRQSHATVASQPPIPVQAPFMVGGWPMMFPGDPMGPVDEVAGCRCELQITKG
jgi:hypothetical protein